MVAIFVVATIIVFMIIDYFVQRSEKRAAATAPAAPAHSKARFVIPKGYFFGKGHTWVEVMSNGMARVGVDDFVQRIVGKVESVSAVPVGTAVHAGDKLFTVSQGKNILSFRAPISGKLAAFNEDLSTLPRLVNNEDYNGGWVAVIQPTDLSGEIRNLPIGDEAARWLKEEIRKFRNFITAQIAPSTAATMVDGGTPVEGALQHVAPSVWEKFENDFLA